MKRKHGVRIKAQELSVFKAVKIVVTHHGKPLKRRSKKKKAHLTTQFWTQYKIWRRRHANRRRRRFGRNAANTDRSDRSSFRFYFELSSPKPNESVREQSYKLGVLQTTVAGLRAWHRARTPTRTSPFSNTYDALTDEMIRNRIVIGIQDKGTKERLLKKENLDKDKTLSICKSNEAATKQLEFMKQDQSLTNEHVNAVGSQAKRPNGKWSRDRTKDPKDTKNTKKNCSRCGWPKKHKKEERKAYSQTCLVCLKPNHFASVCRQKNKPTWEKTTHKGRKRPIVKIRSSRSKRSPAWKHQASNLTLR